MEIGVYLKQLRQERGWTQAELAARSGVSIMTISGIERGRVPAPRTIGRLVGTLIASEEPDRS